MKQWLTIVVICLWMVTPPVAKAEKQAPLKVVVLDFKTEGQGLWPNIEKIVSEWMTTALVQVKGIEVIERRLLDELLVEQKLDNSGLVDASAISRFGHIIGAKAAVSGTILKFLDTIEVNARLIDAESGQILVAAKIETRDPQLLEKLVQQLSQKLAQCQTCPGR